MFLSIGFYLSAQLWKNPSGSRGSILMKVNQPSSEHGECLMFWYHMSGRDVGSLNIYVQELHSAKSQILIWSVSGDQGEQWRHGRATVISPHSPYKVCVLYMLHCAACHLGLKMTNGCVKACCLIYPTH